MWKWTALVAFLLAGPVSAAQEYILPTLFDVQDVAADDVLNIRETPDAMAPIIGTLAHDATGIEVMGTDRSGQWGRVNTGERGGWVSMRFLTYRSDVWQPEKLPAGLTCGGTEPFWSFTEQDGRLLWSTPEGDTVYPELRVLDTGVFRSPRRGLIAEGVDGQVLTATITTAQCSDGMSDMAYGLETMLILKGEGAAQLYTGCCRIAR